MSLTKIQTDAIAKARRGDYSLLDAMELKHWLDKGDAAKGYRVGGRLRFFAVGDPVPNPCDKCDGGENVQCTHDGCDDGDIDCSACAGTKDHTIAHVACDGKGCDVPECIDGQVECDQCGGTAMLTCPACKGDGFVPCDECDGEGEFPPVKWNDLYVVNLDGRELWRADDPEEPDHPTDWEGEVGRDWATKILAAYETECNEAAKAASAPDNNPIQTPLIPENFQCA